MPDKTLDELREDVIKAAREVNLAAFSLLRWGDFDKATGTYHVAKKHMDALEAARMKQKRAIDKLDLELDRPEQLPHVEKSARRKMDEELGFRPRCLTLYNDTARDWGCDMLGRPAYSPRGEEGKIWL